MKDVGTSKPKQHVNKVERLMWDLGLNLSCMVTLHSHKQE